MLTVHFYELIAAMVVVDAEEIDLTKPPLIPGAMQVRGTETIVPRVPQN